MLIFGRVRLLAVVVQVEPPELSYKGQNNFD